MPNTKIKIIIIPGLFKREEFLEKFKDFCSQKNFDVEIFRIEWLENDMYPKNESRLIEKIKNYSKTHNKIFLIGTSAGGSVAVNVFMKTKSLVDKVVCICSPLKEMGFTLALGEIISDKFKDSLSSAIKSLKLLTKFQRRRIMAFIPAHDELVPLRAMNFSGISQKHVNSHEHFMSINKVLNENIDDIVSFFHKN